ncbi:MAG: thermopsin family protease [Thermoproteus sp.]
MFQLKLAVLAALLAAGLAYAAYYISAPGPGLTCWNYWQEGGGYYVFVDYGSTPYTIYIFDVWNYLIWKNGSGAYAWDKFTVEPGQIYVEYAPPGGEYYAVIYPTPCLNSVPVALLNYSAPPIGIASIADVETNKVLGFFNITSYSPNESFSIQLNVYVTDGKNWFWVQNAAQINGSKISIQDNIKPVPLYATNGVISIPLPVLWTVNGTGQIYNESYTAVGLYPPVRFNVPLAGYLLISVDQSGTIHFCYSIIQNGTAYYPPKFTCYDNATIGILLTNANINEIVSDSHHDAELVVGGLANGETAQLTSTKVELALLRWTGGAWAPYSDIYAVGFSTEEGAYGTAVLGNDGFVYVENGTVPTGVPLLSAGLPPTPPLPMTYVETPGGSFYVTTPYTYSAPELVTFDNGTRLMLSGISVNGAFTASGQTTITPASDFTTYVVAPIYETQYLVEVHSRYPVYVNGTYTANYTAWVRRGTVVVVSNPTPFVGWAFLQRETTYVVDKPISVEVAWGVDWLPTIAMYGAVIAIIAGAAWALKRRKR